jgi:LmbE family N-acetylglucosaminyl deacetylase
MHLFLAPHFDDAVLSCGGLIHQLSAVGKPVVVRTVMGGRPHPERLPQSPIVEELHARWGQGADPVAGRIAEDEAAVHSLGAKATHLVNWLDCIYRMTRDGQALYPTGDSIFAGINPIDTTAQLLPTLVLPPEETVEAIYVPLGAGRHVDHLIVRNWGVELAKQYRWLIVRFYEDYPYIETEGALEAGLAAFEALEPPIKLEPEIIRLTEGDIAAKVNAVGLYQSQLSSFWPDAAAMNTAIRAMLVKTGGGTPAERYWTVPGRA